MDRDDLFDDAVQRPIEYKEKTKSFLSQSVDSVDSQALSKHENENEGNVELVSPESYSSIAEISNLSTNRLQDACNHKKVETIFLYEPTSSGDVKTYKLAIESNTDSSITSVGGDDFVLDFSTKKKKIVSCDLGGSGLIGHWNVTEKGTEYICDMDNGKCKRSFTSLPYLKNHQYVHFNSKDLTCTFPDCGRKFTWQHHLQYHLKSHKGVREYKCKVRGCTSSFFTAQQCTVHMRTHSGDKPFVCETCEKKFITLQNLENHVRTHTGEKPFVCDFAGCSKTFAERSSLKKHMVTHTGEKKYKCVHCKKGFTQSSTLQNHVKRYHTENPPPSKSIANIQAQQKAEAEAQAKQLHDMQQTEQLQKVKQEHTNHVITDSEGELHTLSVPYEVDGVQVVIDDYDGNINMEYVDIETHSECSEGRNTSSPDLQNTENMPFITVNPDTEYKLECSSNENGIVFVEQQEPQEISIITSTEGEDVIALDNETPYHSEETQKFQIEYPNSDTNIYPQEADEEYTVYFSSIEH